MKKLFNFLLLSLMVVAFFTLNSCQTCTRQFGGTTEIKLEQYQEFINVTWKDNNIWVLTKNTQTNNYDFFEYSNFGVLQGKVIIKKP